MSTQFIDDFENDDVVEVDHVKQFIQPINDLESGASCYRDATNTANAYKVDFSTGNEVESYTPGLIVHFKAQADNTGASTLTITGPNGDLSAVALVKKGGDPLDAGDISEGQVVAAIYTDDGDPTPNPRFEVLGGLAGTGEPGPTGPQGPQGEPGATGAQGPQGETGATGATGAQGPQGETGATGATGAQGETGSQGPQGVQGPIGPQGPQGETGPAGPGGAEELNDLDDVTISSPSAGQILRYDGSEFTNATLGSGDLPSHTHAASDITSGTLAVARGGVPQDGEENQVLKWESGAPAWAVNSGGGGSGVPVGTVVPFAGTSAPSGWLFLYGQAISRDDYSSLFAALGTTYGAGDGSTTFNLPDLRGRVVAGKDDMGGTSANRLTSPINGDNLGANGGSESHTLTTAQMPSHNHVIGSHSHTIGSHSHTVNSHIHSRPTYTSLQWLQNGTGHTLNNIWAGIGSSSTGSSSPGTSSVSPSCSSVSPSCGSRGSSQAHPNVQPTFILNYIVFAGVP